MKRYMLASNINRSIVDLRDYSKIITEAVYEVMPNAEVEVYENYYSIIPQPSNSEAIRIGRKICKSDLKHYCINVNKLFCSEEY